MHKQKRSRKNTPFDHPPQKILQVPTAATSPVLFSSLESLVLAPGPSCRKLLVGEERANEDDEGGNDTEDDHDATILGRPAIALNERGVLRLSKADGGHICSWIGSLWR